MIDLEAIPDELVARMNEAISAGLQEFGLSPHELYLWIHVAPAQNVCKMTRSTIEEYGTSDDCPRMIQDMLCNWLDEPIEAGCVNICLLDGGKFDYDLGTLDISEPLSIPMNSDGGDA